MSRLVRIALMVMLLGARPSQPLPAQDFTSLDRDRGVMMLRGVKRDLREFYYDTTYHGIDLDARFRAAEGRIREAQSNSEVFAIIAQVLLEFNDSHTLFIPPARAARVEYGWEMSPVGDSVYVTAVKPGSDARTLGLAPGDRVVAINGAGVTRDGLWQFRYFLEVVSPRTQLSLAVERPEGSRAMLEIRSEVIPEPRYQNLTTEGVRQFITEWENRRRATRNREWANGEAVLVWRMATFSQEEREIDRMLGKARRYRALVLDLRDNRGGSAATLRHFVSRLFDRRLLVNVDRRRRKVDSVWTEPRPTPYLGPLIVLVNGETASAGEMLARVVQLEGRGTVIGDRTMGAVMGSYGLGEIAGGVRSVFYGVNVTVMDVRMADGQSLEHVGVRPDEVVLPTPRDLAARRDPVLARAVALAGGTISPAEAGALFPIEWP